MSLLTITITAIAVIILSIMLLDYSQKRHGIFNKILTIFSSVNIAASLVTLGALYISILKYNKGGECFYEKERMLVVKNEGDGDYYIKYDKGYLKTDFNSSDFDELKDDSCVVYKPLEKEILFGLLILNNNQAPKYWILKRGDDLILDEKLIENQVVKIDLK